MPKIAWLMVLHDVRTLQCGAVQPQDVGRLFCSLSLFVELYEEL